MGKEDLEKLEKELMESAAGLDSSSVTPEELEQAAGGCCCGGDCIFISAGCDLLNGIAGTLSTCQSSCRESSPS